MTVLLKQFNVTSKIEEIEEIWRLQIVRNGIWSCPRQKGYLPTRSERL